MAFCKVRQDIANHAADLDDLDWMLQRIDELVDEGFKLADAVKMVKAEYYEEDDICASDERLDDDFTGWSMY